MRDPYSVLGVNRKAKIEDIKQAYRALAKRYHPDLVQDDGDCGGQFKEISSAYGLLSNSAKRAEYDKGEICADGRPTSKARAEARKQRSKSRSDGPIAASRARPSPKPKPKKASKPKPEPEAMQEEPRKPSAQSASFKIKADEVVNELFANVKAKARPKESQVGRDETYALAISFEDSARGTSRRVKMPDGKRLNVKIPAGVRCGQQIRLRGQGNAGLNGGSAGDALIEISVEAHKHFSRKGHDVVLTVPIGVDEAILGSKVMVPTLDGPVAIKIPPQSNTDTVLSIQGKGFPLPSDGPTRQLGNQLVVLKVVLPPKADATFSRVVKKWAAQNPYEVAREFDFSAPSR